MHAHFSKTIFAFACLSILLFALPVHATSAGSRISTQDVRSFNPATFGFNGGNAFSFRPGVVSIEAGGTVSFTDNGYEEHTVTSFTNTVLVNFEGLDVYIPVPDGHFDSGIAHPIESGETWTLDTTGLAGGDYKYFCQIHPWMQALLRIVSSGSPTAQVNIDHHLGDTSQFFSASASWGFFPRTLNVQRGTQVTVSNDGHVFHTVSSYTVAFPVNEGFKTLMIPISDGVFNQTLAPGQSWTLDTGQLNTGTYTYACLFHPWMLGTLVVR